MTDAASYNGLLLIGDPHLEGRQPGFRKDDYPNVILGKLGWCLDYAARERLLPAILGDLFDKPRDNPNWLLGRLLELLRGEVLGLYGNHDVHYHPELTDDDSLSLLVKAGRLRLLSAEAPWRGTIGGRTVIVGGSSYRQDIPQQFEPPAAQETRRVSEGASLATQETRRVSEGASFAAQTASPSETDAPLVIWLTHHDILIPGYDEGRIKPCEVPGVDLVVNGHIHRKLADVEVGRTRWLTPGNISRRARGDATRAHVPSALRIDVTPAGYSLTYVEVPHRPFDDVFHEAAVATPDETRGSAFIAGLAELQTRRTVSGAGLMEFLECNIGEFEPAVAEEIMKLASEVNDGQTA